MNRWKVFAIIFIVLFILETIFFVGILSWGISEENKENQCIYDVCSSPIYNSYIYYDFKGICECYINGILDKTEYIK